MLFISLQKYSCQPCTLIRKKKECKTSNKTMIGCFWSDIPYGIFGLFIASLLRDHFANLFYLSFFSFVTFLSGDVKLSSPVDDIPVGYYKRYLFLHENVFHYLLILREYFSASFKCHLFPLRALIPKDRDWLIRYNDGW